MLCCTDGGFLSWCSGKRRRHRVKSKALTVVSGDEILYQVSIEFQVIIYCSSWVFSCDSCQLWIRVTITRLLISGRNLMTDSAAFSSAGFRVGFQGAASTLLCASVGLICSPWQQWLRIMGIVVFKAIWQKNQNNLEKKTGARVETIRTDGHDIVYNYPDDPLLCHSPRWTRRC